ncbi:putative Peroxiredoxin [Vibrio nigripulchritudo SO65]|uniref:redoxin domain-containing protein n=1 Tax=Vibrio nigripulchritudo TaxID=28173 RepID=UPI0003B19816|nr:redoxin domain-containing protein [Vibrio nigripulchritudo]CCN34763.1 putative Peroxiredoxin [Vibrio nigripulchritudo AM115]CCN43740.1 putative Peroxiredoxin [Vibrio nigripulchritudo FTn2]CCN65222.1 putative Peroxiredoxin [Vibrio nigripulchritudo POn4]CCN74918.1 putative Peroxiredoxin [Vibrio nigripulchritudo SO65]
MGHSVKLKAGDKFPEISATLLDGSDAVLGQPKGDATWQAVIVYRGKHCPLCTKYLNEIESHKKAFEELGIDILAVSGDAKHQLEAHLEQLDVSFPIAYGLTEEQMKTLGLYISKPRSEQETDHNFAEPGLFVVNENGGLQVVDIANSPFVRPELGALTRGLAWIRNPENNYPIRGTVDY